MQFGIVGRAHRHSREGKYANWHASIELLFYIGACITEKIKFLPSVNDIVHMTEPLRKLFMWSSLYRVCSEKHSWRRYPSGNINIIISQESLQTTLIGRTSNPKLLLIEIRSNLRHCRSLWINRTMVKTTDSLPLLSSQMNDRTTKWNQQIYQL